MWTSYNKRKNRNKARVRAKVEHPFRIVKRIFGFEKARYRGLRRTTSVCARPSRWSISISTANGWPGSERSVFGNRQNSGFRPSKSLKNIPPVDSSDASAPICLKQLHGDRLRRASLTEDEPEFMRRSGSLHLLATFRYRPYSRGQFISALPKIESHQD